MDVEVILKTCLEKDDLHRFLRKVLGNGGIFAPGKSILFFIVPIWRRRRKILIPVFTPKNIDQFVTVFSENSQKLVKKLVSHQGKGKFSIWPYMSAYTLDSVGETALGVQINSQGDSNSSFLTSMNIILDLVCERIFHLWLQPDWLFKLFPQYKLHQKSIKVLHDFTDEVIVKKRAEISQYKTLQSEDLGEYQNKTFLDLLISSSGGEKGYNNVELREEILTLTIAGTDTSAVATGYTLMLLAKYPKIQDKVYEELYEIFGDSNRPVTKQDLLDLKYLERVVKESLRLFPPVPFIIRKVETEVKLPSGRVLPAGSGAVVCIWGCHRDPKYWGPDAEHFDPDRFLPERFNLKHGCSYMPFSNGPRNCVGYQYALMSIKTSLAWILQNNKVVGEPEDGPIPHIKVKLNVMMKDITGYQVALEKRQPKSDIQLK
ncbi:unnamed protein product, partial [Brenthis ino]